MFYITGDTHGDFSRVKEFCQRFQTTKDDYLIILGDAGINYFGLEDRTLKEELSKLPITLLCVYGNHEERPSNISTYQEIRKFDSVVYQEKEYPNLLFFKDGEIYNIKNQKILVVGGAFSINKELMIESGYKWFKDEQPNEIIKARTLENLNNNQYQIDIILSHTCPLKYVPVEMFHIGVNQDEVDQETEYFLDLIENITKYKRWYCGHFHTNKIVDKINFLFEDIKELNN